MRTNQNAKEQLLETARTAFLEKGYKDVSMRHIAKMSDMALGNIYYYFKSKDDLFQTILTPAIREIKKIIMQHNGEDEISIDVFYTQNNRLASKSVVNEFSSFIQDYGDDAYLLLFMAQGSSLESFTEDLTQDISDMSLEYLSKMKKKYPDINIDISPFFIHVYISCCITMLKEIVSHRKIWLKESEQYLKDLETFTISGWKELMRV